MRAAPRLGGRLCHDQGPIPTDILMPSSNFASNAPSFDVDHVDQPALSASLQSMVISWPSAGQVMLQATFADWGSTDGRPPSYLWSDGGLVKTGVTVGVRFGTDGPLSGTVVAVKSQLASSAAPVFALCAKGAAPVGKTVPPRILRWPNDLQRMDAAREVIGPNQTTRVITAEALAAFAFGPVALRPDVPIGILGAGSLFNGPYVMSEVSLHFDLAKGLRLEFTAKDSHLRAAKELCESADTPLEE